MHERMAGQPTLECRLLAALARASRGYRTRRTPPSHVRQLEDLGATERADWFESARAYNEARMVDRYLKAREYLNPGYQSLFQHALHPEFLAARAARAPTLLLFWHCGIMRSTFSALAGLGTDLVLIKSGRVYAAQSAQLDLLVTDETSPNRAVANARLLKKAVERLRAGDMVATFVDGTNGASTSQVRFFGRSISPRGSIEALVRRTDARVFPCVSHWNSTDQRLELLVGPDLRRGQGERSGILQSATDWFADHLAGNLSDVTSASLYLLNHGCTQARRGDHGALSTRRC